MFVVDEYFISVAMIIVLACFIGYLTGINHETLSLRCKMKSENFNH